MLRKGLGPASFKSALFGGLAVVAVLGIASWAFERGLYRPSVVQRGHITAFHLLIEPREQDTREKSDQLYDEFVENYVRTIDANNILYRFEASYDYNPAPDLGKIRAKL